MPSYFWNLREMVKKILTSSFFRHTSNKIIHSCTWPGSAWSGERWETLKITHLSRAEQGKNGLTHFVLITLSIIMVLPSHQNGFANITVCINVIYLKGYSTFYRYFQMHDDDDRRFVQMMMMMVVIIVKLCFATIRRENVKVESEGKTPFWCCWKKRDFPDWQTNSKESTGCRSIVMAFFLPLSV